MNESEAGLFLRALHRHRRQRKSEPSGSQNAGTTTVGKRRLWTNMCIIITAKSKYNQVKSRFHQAKPKLCFAYPRLVELSRGHFLGPLQDEALIALHPLLSFVAFLASEFSYFVTASCLESESYTVENVEGFTQGFSFYIRVICRGRLTVLPH